MTRELVYHGHMKTILALLVSLSTLGVMAQTNTPPAPPLPVVNLDFLTNLPSVDNFQDASFALSTGPVALKGDLLYQLSADTFIHTNYVIRGEILNLIDQVHSLGLYGGVRKAWPSAHVYSLLGGRRIFGTDLADRRPNWQIVFKGGADWIVMQGGKVKAGTEFGLATARDGFMFRKVEWEVTPIKVTWLF